MGYFQAKKIVTTVLLIPFILIVGLLVIVRFFFSRKFQFYEMEK
ncbi:hypothetical protein [Lederbergia sp. NSJ-179]|nr:hypothetical protein [Lederbergia sp. NSJ-179]